MEVSSVPGLKLFHHMGVDGGPDVPCRGGGGGGKQRMEIAEGARPEMRQNKTGTTDLSGMVK